MTMLLAAPIGFLLIPAGAAMQGRGHDRGGGYHSVRGADRPDRRDESRAAFTRSAEGRRFENGVTLRRGAALPDNRASAYFRGGVVSYPHYAYVPSSTVIVSPYHLYGRAFPPYVSRAAVLFAPPPVVYVEVPVVLSGGSPRHASSRSSDDYYLNRPNLDDVWKSDPELKQAVYDLEDSFRNDDISLLGPLTADDVKIAVYNAGKYEYSLQPGDYLDITRDFMRTARTTNFSAYRVRRKTADAYQVFAKHDYKDEDGDVKSVYLCFVLERVSHRWTITQVESSQARLDR
jgi:hypothetical protein